MIGSTLQNEIARAYLTFCAHLPAAACPKIFRKFWDRRRFPFCRLPAQNFPEILGAGNIWRRFAAFFAPKFSGNFGTETLFQEITRYLKFVGNFGTVRPKFSGNFGTIFLILSCQISGKFRLHEIFRQIWNRSSGRQISRKFRSHEIFREIWNRSSGAVCRNFPKFLGSKIFWKFWGRFAVFFVPKLSGNFGTRNASSRDYTKRQIYR